jgi:hypothetical protein
VALVSQPAIGRSLLGESGYAALQQRLQPDQHALVIAGDGRYSFKGSGYVRGGIFDRIEVHQDTETIRFRDRLHQRIDVYATEGNGLGMSVCPSGMLSQLGRRAFKADLVPVDRAGAEAGEVPASAAGSGEVLAPDLPRHLFRARVPETGLDEPVVFTRLNDGAPALYFNGRLHRRPS